MVFILVWRRKTTTLWDLNGILKDPKRANRGLCVVARGVILRVDARRRFGSSVYLQRFIVCAQISSAFGAQRIRCPPKSIKSDKERTIAPKSTLITQRYSSETTLTIVHKMARNERDFAPHAIKHEVIVKIDSRAISLF